MSGDHIHNPHAGDILQHEFMTELSLSQNALARAIAVPANRIHGIVGGLRRITADTDLRLCTYFGLSEGYFLRLQNLYETMEAKQEIADQLAQIIPYQPKQDSHNGA